MANMWSQNSFQLDLASIIQALDAGGGASAMAPVQLVLRALLGQVLAGGIRTQDGTNIILTFRAR